jgi:hypothetical protein
MSVAKQEVFVCSLIYKMMGVSLLLQTAVIATGIFLAFKLLKQLRYNYSFRDTVTLQLQQKLLPNDIGGRLRRVSFVLQNQNIGGIWYSCHCRRNIVFGTFRRAAMMFAHGGE